MPCHYGNDMKGKTATYHVDIYLVVRGRLPFGNGQYVLKIGEYRDPSTPVVYLVFVWFWMDPFPKKSLIFFMPDVSTFFRSLTPLD